MKMNIKITILLMMLSTAATVSNASGFSAVSISPDYKGAVLKDPSTGLQWNAKIGDEIQGWRLEGITENYVTISKVYKGKILMSKLPVPERNLAPRQQLPTYMNKFPAPSSSGSIINR
jgi:hypothetical protein